MNEDNKTFKHNVYLPNGNFVSDLDELFLELPALIGDQATNALKQIGNANAKTYEEYTAKWDNYERSYIDLSHAVSGYYNEITELLENIKTAKRLNREELTTTLKALLVDISNFV